MALLDKESVIALFAGYYHDNNDEKGYAASRGDIVEIILTSLSLWLVILINIIKLDIIIMSGILSIISIIVVTAFTGLKMVIGMITGTKRIARDDDTEGYQWWKKRWWEMIMMVLRFIISCHCHDNSYPCYHPVQLSSTLVPYHYPYHYPLLNCFYPCHHYNDQCYYHDDKGEKYCVACSGDISRMMIIEIFHF